MRSRPLHDDLVHGVRVDDRFGAKPEAGDPEGELLLSADSGRLRDGDQTAKFDSKVITRGGSAIACCGASISGRISRL
jgi:uncharacterized Zn-binding protein involved in type VI secretion